MVFLIAFIPNTQVIPMLLLQNYNEKRKNCSTSIYRFVIESNNLPVSLGEKKKTPLN